MRLGDDLQGNLSSEVACFCPDDAMYGVVVTTHFKVSAGQENVRQHFSTNRRLIVSLIIRNDDPVIHNVTP